MTVARGHCRYVCCVPDVTPDPARTRAAVLALAAGFSALALAMLAVAPIVGAGTARRASSVRWGVASNIVWAWVLTIPASAFVAAIGYWLSLQLY